MTRVPAIINREDLAPDKRHIWDEIVASRRQVGQLWGMILNSPEVAGRLAHFGTYVRFESPVPLSTRELAMVVTAKHWEHRGEWVDRTRAAQRAGISPETIKAVETGAALNGLPQDDAIVIRMAHELLDKHKVSDEAFQAVQQRYGDQGAIDLMAAIAFMSALICVVGGLEIPYPGRE